VDSEIGFDDRHCVAPHLGGAGLMPEGHDAVAEEALGLANFPGITSRFAKGLSAAELPISRHSSTQAIAAGHRARRGRRATVFLASPRAANVTGGEFVTDGGQIKTT
jgi:hypothetical protein